MKISFHCVSQQKFVEIYHGNTYLNNILSIYPIETYFHFICRQNFVKIYK